MKKGKGNWRKMNDFFGESIICHVKDKIFILNSSPSLRQGREKRVLQETLTF